MSGFLLVANSCSGGYSIVKLPLPAVLSAVRTATALLERLGRHAEAVADGGPWPDPAEVDPSSLPVPDGVSLTDAGGLPEGARVDPAAASPFRNAFRNGSSTSWRKRVRMPVASDPAFGSVACTADEVRLTLDDGTVVPPSELERLMCDCEITRLVLDADGVPLDVGQTQRTYTKELRRAILTRDGHCQWPGCTTRASWCEVHHIHEWVDGGETTLSNLVMLCKVHHRQIHSTDWIVRIRDSVARADSIRRAGLPRAGSRCWRAACWRRRPSRSAPSAT